MVWIRKFEHYEEKKYYLYTTSGDESSVVVTADNSARVLCVDQRNFKRVSVYLSTSSPITKNKVTYIKLICTIQTTIITWNYPNYLWVEIIQATCKVWLLTCESKDSNHMAAYFLVPTLQNGLSTLWSMHTVKALFSYSPLDLSSENRCFFFCMCIDLTPLVFVKASLCSTSSVFASWPH